MTTAVLTKTNRREKYESYIRFLLARIGLSEPDIEGYMTSKQAALDDKSIIEMVYSGDYRRAVDIIEDETYVPDAVLMEESE